MKKYLSPIAAARHSGGMTSLGPAFSPLSGKSPVVQIAGIVMSAVACLILRIESGKMEFAAHVFEAFERERTSTVSGIQGTGLGMAITKSIVELMKGTIRVETGRRPEMAERGPDAFDLVLTDMFMPKTTGEELVAAIRADARFDSLPVFLFTADVEFKEGFAEKGFDGVLIKPATLESLGEMLAQRAIRVKK